MIFLISILALIAVDFFSKKWMLDYFINGGIPFQVTEFFNITFLWNRGISFGLLGGASPFITQFLEYGIPLVILGIIIWLIRTSDPLLKWGLTFIVGGAIGNVLDRLQYGAVIDFLDFHCYEYHWYTFNVADASVCVGAFIVILSEYAKKRGKHV